MAFLQLLVIAVLATQDPAPTEAREVDAIESEAGPSAEERAYVRALSASLRASASPRERALSTHFFDWQSESEASDAAARGRRLREAAAAAPSDVLVQAMWAATDDAGGGCDARSPCPERRFAQARLEPDNGLAWIPAFPALGAEASDAEIEALLEKLAAAERYDDYFVEHVRAWNQVLSSRPMPLQREPAEGDTPSPYLQHPRVMTQIAAIAHAAAMIHANWQPVFKLCKRSEQPQAPARRFELCAQAGRKLMRRATSAVGESFGSALLRISGLATAEDRLYDRRRQWRMMALVKLDPSMESPKEFSLYFDDLLSTGVESQAIELEMQRKGIALEPPADWHAPDNGM